ncbi:MAG: recombinase RecA [Clostridiales bacterium]|nr:recombinase RecA [Clostridiales bacterium]
MAAKKSSNSSVKVVPPTDKSKALETAISQIERAYGKGSIMRMGDNASIQVEAIPTGSLGLDLALGIGGVPRGRIVEIYGPESSGKTTLALHIVAQAQKLGGEVAYIDAEHAMDPSYARALGVDIDSMLISQPDTGEQGLEICEQLVRSGALDVVVVDSVAALVPRSEIEGEMGDSFVGLQARLMSQALRKLAGCISKTNCVVIFINQLREKIGVMYGNPETTTGGRALKFYASVRIDIRRIQSLKVGGEIVGNHTRAKVVKNKVAPPFREAEFDIMYGEGISQMGELVDLGVQLGLVEKSGSWFSMGETRLGQGRDNAKLYFKDHPEEAAKLEADIRANSYKLLSRQGLAAAKAAGRAPAEEAAPAESAPEEPAPIQAPAPRDMDDFDQLMNGLDISAEDFEG